MRRLHVFVVLRICNALEISSSVINFKTMSAEAPFAFGNVNPAFVESETPVLAVVGVVPTKKARVLTGPKILGTVLGIGGVTILVLLTAALTQQQQQRCPQR